MALMNGVDRREEAAEAGEATEIVAEISEAETENSAKNLQPRKKTSKTKSVPRLQLLAPPGAIKICKEFRAQNWMRVLPWEWDIPND